MGRHLLVFLVSAAIGFGLLTTLTGGPTLSQEIQDNIVKITPDAVKGSPTKVTAISMKWKGRPIGLTLTPNQVVEKVDVPLVDPETQLEEGRFLFESGRYDTRLNRLRVIKPRLIMWSLDRERKLVNRQRQTTLVAEYGLIDPDFKLADMFDYVTVTSDYKDSQGLLQTTHLRCHLQQNLITTDRTVSITWGEDFKVIGEGLESTPKTEEMTILRNVLVSLVQREGKIAMPFTAVSRKPKTTPVTAKPTRPTKIISTCDGKMVLKRLTGKAYQVTLYRNVEVIRGKGRIRSQVLQLGFEHVRKPTPDKGKKGADKKEKGIDLRRMTAYDRVHMFHPTQGEAQGEFYRWERLPSRKQRSVLRGSPRLVLTERAHLKVVEGDPRRKKKKSERPSDGSNRTIITSKGEMVFLRNPPEQTTDPELAVFHDRVILRRMKADLKQGQPLEIRANKLTLLIDVEAPETQASAKQTEQPERKARVRRALAEGDVRVIDPSFEATGQRCNWYDLDEGDEKMVMLGRPKLILKAVDDDEQVGLPGATPPKGNKQPPKKGQTGQAKSDVEITSRGTMVMRSYQNRAQTRGIFDEDVVVRQFPLSTTGQRLPDHEGGERRSTLLTDHLEVDLLRAAKPVVEIKNNSPKSGSSFTMREMRAKGNVQISSTRGQATSQELRYQKSTDTILLTDDVLMLSPDGSRYKGDQLTYWRRQDKMLLVASLPRWAEVRQIEDPPKEARKGIKRAEHLIRAPQILYDRRKHYIKASNGVYCRFLPRSDKEKDSFFGMGDPPNRGPKDTKGKPAPRTPWVLKARQVEAWLEPPVDKKQDAHTSERSGSGQLRRLLAREKVHIYSTAEKDPR